MRGRARSSSGSTRMIRDCFRMPPGRPRLPRARGTAAARPVAGRAESTRTYPADAEVQMSDRVAFTCNGAAVDVPIEPTESLLSVLRERLRLLSVKDGCAPQGQCGCCTVLVDGEPRVACVTPAERVDGRTVTTIEGLDDETRARLAGSFVGAGGSQCGFCTPGILMRVSGARTRDLDRALAAHLCRCTGWLTIYRAIERGVGATERRFRAAARRAELEGGTAQVVDVEVPIGGAPFADDTAPEGAIVAVPLPPGSAAESVDAAGFRWVVGNSLLEARAAAG